MTVSGHVQLVAFDRGPVADDVHRLGSEGGVGERPQPRGRAGAGVNDQTWRERDGVRARIGVGVLQGLLEGPRATTQGRAGDGVGSSSGSECDVLGEPGRVSGRSWRIPWTAAGHVARGPHRRRSDSGPGEHPHRQHCGDQDHHRNSNHTTRRLCIHGIPSGRSAGDPVNRMKLNTPEHRHTPNSRPTGHPLPDNRLGPGSAEVNPPPVPVRLGVAASAAIRFAFACDWRLCGEDSLIGPSSSLFGALDLGRAAPVDSMKHVVVQSHASLGSRVGSHGAFGTTPKSHEERGAKETHSRLETPNPWGPAQ